MSAEPAADAPWPYALTLICADGPREFRFRIDPVEPERPFGRGGNSLRAASLPAIAGRLVAEKLNPWTTGGTGPGFWSLPSFHEASAIALAAEPRLGRLRANPANFTMPGRDDDFGPLDVLAVKWTRWAGDDLDENQAPKHLGPGARYRIASRRTVDGDGGAIAVGKTEMSREIGMRLVADLNRVYPDLVRWLVPADAHAVLVYDRERADLAVGRPLLDHRGEVVGRELILFEDEPGSDTVLDSKMRLSEKIWTKLVSDKRRAEELLGEVIEMLEEDGHYKAWTAAARPFARFPEAK